MSGRKPLFCIVVGWVEQSVAPQNPSFSHDPAWAEWAHEEIISRANGSTFLEISKANFRPISVVTPPSGVFGEFDQLVRPLYARVVSNERESRTLAALRDTLLPKLISGELRVQDAEDLVERAVRAPEHEPAQININKHEQGVDHG